MFKKIVIASAILATSSSIAFADAAPYVGASLGLNSTNYKLNDALSTNTNFNSSGLNGGVYAGYGATLSNNFYLGGEALLKARSFSTSTKLINGGTTNAKLTSSYSYGVSVLPGYKFTDTLLGYVRAGVVKTRFKLAQDNLGSKTDSLTGGQLGLGLQTELVKNVNLRGEFVHTRYSSFKAFGSSVKPRNNEIDFGLGYSFG